MKLWPIAQYLHSSEARVFGYRIYGKAPAALKWLGLKVLRPLTDLSYAFKYRFVREHQYNIVRTGLKPGYYDVDTCMLHSCFALLLRFIEADGGLGALRENVGLNGYEQEVLDLHDWWTVQKPRDEAREDELLTILYGGDDRMTFVPIPGTSLSEIKLKEREANEQPLLDEHQALQEKIRADEQRMLHRLIEIRQHLWT